MQRPQQQRGGEEGSRSEPQWYGGGYGEGGRWAAFDDITSVDRYGSPAQRPPRGGGDLRRQLDRERHSMQHQTRGGGRGGLNANTGPPAALHNVGGDDLDQLEEFMLMEV